MLASHQFKKFKSLLFIYNNNKRILRYKSTDTELLKSATTSFVQHHKSYNQKHPMHPAVNNFVGAWKPIQLAIGANRQTEFTAFSPNMLLSPKIDMSYYNSQLIPLSYSLEKTVDAIAALDKSTFSLRSRKSIAACFMKKEAVCSNRIENNTRTLRDLLTMHINSETSNSGNYCEIQDIVQTLGLMKKYDIKSKISVDKIEEMHSLLMKNTTSLKPHHIGKIRDQQNFIGAIGSSKIVFPPPPQDVPALMKNLCDFMNSPPPDLHPLVAAGIAHGQFELIHPFFDGNGRLGRVLLSMELQKQNSQFLLPSFGFYEYCSDYFRELYELPYVGQWESFLHFYLDSLGEAALDAADLLKEVIAIEQADIQLLNSRYSEKDIAICLEAIYTNPYVTPHYLQDVFRSKNTDIPDKLIQSLVHLGILDVEENNVYPHNKFLGVLYKTRRLEFKNNIKRLLLDQIQNKDEINR